MSGETIAEKILADSAGVDRVTPGEHVVCEIDRIHMQDHTTFEIAKILEEYEIDSLCDPSTVAIVLDHEAPPLGEERGVIKANEDQYSRKFAEDHGISDFFDYGSGISHNVLPEKGHIAPGQLAVGADSHTTTFGAFGAAATGMGRKDIAYALATGQQWFRVPESIKIDVRGTFEEGVTEKDLVLHIIKEFGVDVGHYRSIEYTGELMENLPIDRRMTLSNMGIELGAKFAFTPVDDTVFEYIDEVYEGPYDPKPSDPDADYGITYSIDGKDVTPMVSKPHHQKNVVGVDRVAGVEIDVVFIGSCTNGQYQDLADAAELLEGEAVNPDVRLIVTPASEGVSRKIAEDDTLLTLQRAGAIITHPTCGACAGTGPGVLGDGEVCLAAQNRNARGRMGSEEAEIYLSSPKTAAASAITGEITNPVEVQG